MVFVTVNGFATMAQGGTDSTMERGQVLSKYKPLRGGIKVNTYFTMI